MTLVFLLLSFVYSLLIETSMEIVDLPPALLANSSASSASKLLMSVLTVIISLSLSDSGNKLRSLFSLPLS